MNEKSRFYKLVSFAEVLVTLALLVLIVVKDVSAAPSSRDFSQGNSGQGASTSHLLDMPTNVSTGDTLLCNFGMDDTTSPDDPQWPAGWNRIYFGQVLGQITIDIRWKKATGTEGGTTITVTTNTANEWSEYICYSIQDAADPDETPPVASAFVEENTTTPTSAGITGLAAADYRCYASSVMDNGNRTVIAYPTGYTDDQLEQRSATAASVTLAAASVAPGPGSTSCGPHTWTWDGTGEQTTAADVAIAPAAGGVSAVFRRRRQ